MMVILKVAYHLKSNRVILKRNLVILKSNNGKFFDV